MAPAAPISTGTGTIRKWQKTSSSHTYATPQCQVSHVSGSRAVLLGCIGAADKRAALDAWAAHVCFSSWGQHCRLEHRNVVAHSVFLGLWGGSITLARTYSQ